MIPPSRRDLLTGEALRRVIEAGQSGMADALLAVDQLGRPLPQVGDTIRLETRAMACAWCVILNPARPEQVLLASDALSRVHEVEARLTVYRPESEVSQFNRSVDLEPVPISTELRDLLEICRQLWTETDRAFDPATASLTELWSACRKELRVPTDCEVQLALEKSGLQHLEWDKVGDQPTLHRLREGVGLNFGAIGKGEGIDRVTAGLLMSGVEEFLVHGGYSTLRADGSHAGEPGWPVGLKNPLFTDESYLTLMLVDQALSTSGSNIQYFRHEGKRYGHILDSRTGWPASGLLSVSVIAPTATEADALSTSFYAMGLEKSVEYCDTHPLIGAILTPPPRQGRQLDPVVCNIPPERIYFDSPHTTPQRSE
ncbi:MAG: FAD:protein FMN transferase [Planctomycetaceae bacterium]